MTRQGPSNTVGAIARGDDFWGREADVQALWSRLHHGSVLLTAPRRYGKSSLMNALVDAPQSGWIVEYLDVESVATPDEFLVAVTATLLARDKLRKALHGVVNAAGKLGAWVGGLIKDATISREQIGELRLQLRDGLSDKSAWPELSQHLLAALQRVEGERLLLIIDEFPMMVATFLDRDPAVAIHFLRWLRSIRQQPGTNGVRFLLGGSVNIDPRLERIGHQALLNDLDRFTVEPFTPARAVEFVAAVLAAEELPHEEGVAAEIVRVAECGIPFFLQLLIQECGAESRRQARAITVIDVEEVFHGRVRGPNNRARFSHYQSRLKEHYGELEDAARLVLRELVHHQTRSLAELTTAFRAVDEDASRLDPVLALLESDYYIERERDHVWFANGFLRQWWQRHATGGRGRS